MPSLVSAARTTPARTDASAALLSRVSRLLSDQAGAVIVEYAAVTGFVAVVSFPALLFAAWAVAHSFAFVRQYMLYPFP